VLSLTWITLLSCVAVEEEEAVDPTTAEMDGLTFVVEDDEDTGAAHSFAAAAHSKLAAVIIISSSAPGIA
jgi:hypothetical protein